MPLFIIAAAVTNQPMVITNEIDIIHCFGNK
jgi:hypothetical protein